VTNDAMVRKKRQGTNKEEEQSKEQIKETKICGAVMHPPSCFGLLCGWSKSKHPHMVDPLTTGTRTMALKPPFSSL